MALIKAKPTSPARRHVVQIKTPGLWKGGPFSPLVVEKRKTGGRDNYGHISTRHIGGGHKQRYRLIDFKRQKDGIEARVERVEYDTNRSAHIALILYKDGVRSYILAPKGLKAGDTVVSGVDAPIEVGNTLPMENIPLGTVIHGVELVPGNGATFARSAGAYCELLAKEGQYVTLRMRSGEMRRVLAAGRATIGEIGNGEHMLAQLGKAGAKRWLGIRPTVRGMSMNPIDHPHGGGEGRNKGIQPRSPWGTPCKGFKTRKNKRTEKYIVHHR